MYLPESRFYSFIIGNSPLKPAVFSIVNVRVDWVIIYCLINVQDYDKIEGCCTVVAAAAAHI
jgi:hypothetical protein